MEEQWSNGQPQALSPRGVLCVLYSKWVAPREPRDESEALGTDFTSDSWFPKTEFQRIVDATYAYGEWRGGRDFHFRADRLRALVLLMRWSGLSIQDGVTHETWAVER